MQTIRSANNDDNTGYCDILSTLTAMQRTMLEPPTMQHQPRHTDNNADNDVRSTHNDDNTGYCDNLSTLTTMQTTMLEAPTTMTTLATATTSAH